MAAGMAAVANSHAFAPLLTEHSGPGDAGGHLGPCGVWGSLSENQAHQKTFHLPQICYQ